MATLTGAQIKDTYTGLIKTTDNAGITSSLKRITDGAGASTALQLSDSKLRADALEVNTVVENNSRTKLLNWDSSDGVIGYYSFSSADPAVSASISSDDVTVTTGTNAANTFTLISGDNITMSLSGTDITIDATGGLDDLFASAIGSGINTTTTIASSDAGKTFSLAGAGATTHTINLPTAVAGLSYEFKIMSTTTQTSYVIKAASGDSFNGAIALTNQGIRGSQSDGSDTRLPYTLISQSESSDDTITLGPGVTSGNGKGSYVRCIARDADKWLVEGHVFNALSYTEHLSIKGMPQSSDAPDLFSNT